MEQEPLSGTALLILDLPPSSLCGIDLFSFQTSPRFQGIRQIPNGWHFVFAAVNDSLAIRHGAWFYVYDSAKPQPNIIIKKWDLANEVFVDDNNFQSALSPSRVQFENIWRDRLTPYRSSPPKERSQSAGDVFEIDQGWTQLTDCISEDLLSRVLGRGSSQNFWALTSASSARADVDDIPGLSKQEQTLYGDKELGVLPIDLKQTWRQGAIGRERTEAAQDRSWALANLVQEHCHKLQDIIGELQFSFLMVLTLNNNSCLEQWKRILTLLLTCKSAVVTQPDFFVQFLACLRLQLEHCQDAEGGLFDLSDDGAPLLKSLLRRFRQGLDQQTGPAKIAVMDELEELEDFLKLEYDWGMNEPQLRSGFLQLEDGEQVQARMTEGDEDDDNGEYAPTIVDLTPEQAHAMGLAESTYPAQQVKSSTLERQIEAEDEQDEQDNEDLDLEGMDARY